MTNQINLGEVSSRAAFYLAKLQVNSKKIGQFRYKYIEAGKGDTVMLFHGAGGSKMHWCSVIRYLSKSYHVLAFDVPGYTPSFSIGYIRPSFKFLSEWLWAFIDDAEIKSFVMVGYSASAGFACYAASQRPSYIENLILISMPKWPGLNSEKTPLLFRMHKEIEGTLEERAAQYANIVFFQTPPLSAVMRKPLSLSFGLVESRFEDILEATHKDFLCLPSKLKSILGIPIIAIYGAEDRFGANEASEYFERHVENFSSHVIQRCGHIPYLEQPKELAEKIVLFLEAKPIRHGNFVRVMSEV